jgi:hypothetical protein
MLLPVNESAPTMNTLTKPAIRAYSMAVAPNSARLNPRIPGLGRAVRKATMIG